jgi:hypothetical protein
MSVFIRWIQTISHSEEFLRKLSLTVNKETGQFRVLHAHPMANPEHCVIPGVIIPFGIVIFLNQPNL